MFAYFRAPLPWTEIGRRTVKETFEDGCPGLAAQLAFYFLLAVFPAMLVVIAILSYLPIEPAIGAVLERLHSILPQEVIGLIRQELDSVFAGASRGLLTFGIAGAIWSSSSAMTAIIGALNRAYDIEEWRSWWKLRALAVALTVALAVFVVAAFAMVVSGSDIAAWLAGRAGLGGQFHAAWPAIQWPLTLGLVVFVVDLIYFLAPNADTEWVWLTPGAVLATALWLAVSVGFKIYLQHFGSYSAVYGTIGGVIVLMLWFYLSGFALLIGAELNSEIDKALPTHDDAPQRPRRRKRIGPAAERSRS